MPKLNWKIPNLVNGVSQQSDNLRFASQAAEQINFVSSITEGLQKRPPSEHIAKIFNANLLSDSTFFHHIIRDDNEQYLVIIDDGANPDLKVVDLTGASQTILNSGASPIVAADKTYLQCNNPRQDLRALTIADYTFILNKTKTVSAGSTSSDSRDPEGLIFCKQAGVSLRYNVVLYNTPSTSTPDYSVNFTTASSGVITQEDVIAGLITALNSAGANGAGYSYTQSGSVMYITHATYDFKIEVVCENSDHIIAIKDNIESIQDLPAQGYRDFKVKIRGTAEETADDYWVKFEPNQTSTGTEVWPSGTWVESVEPGIIIDLDEDTMPHVLISGASNFTFKPATWDTRLVGDATTNPNPSFVGQTLRGLAFRQNRLELFSKEETVLSEEGQYFNFFRTSVVQVLDSDRIDRSVPAKGISFINYGEEIGRNFVLFSDKVIFTSSQDEVLNSSYNIRTDTVESSDINVQPVAVGDRIFFTRNTGDFSEVKELRLDVDRQVLDAKAVSDHAPRYISGNVLNMSVASGENILAVNTDGLDNGFYLYQFFEQDRQKLQSAWHKFTYSTESNVRYVFFKDAVLYVVVDHVDGAYLESINMAAGTVDTASDFLTSIDRRIDDTQATSITYSAITGNSKITLPFSLEASEVPVVTTRDTASTTGGVVQQIASYTTTTIDVVGDITSTDLWIGVKFSSEYTFSTILLRPEQSNGRAEIRGKIRMRNGVVEYSDTMGFDISVTTEHGETFTYEYNAFETADASWVPGQPAPITDGVFEFPLRGDGRNLTVKIVNDRPFPSNITRAGFEATYSIDSRSV